MPRTFFVDPDNGNDANDGLTFANRKKTINSAASTLTAGDEVRVIANTEPTNIGTCTWNQYSTIALPEGETAGLYNDGRWAGAQAGITIGTPSPTIVKEGTNSALLQIANTYTGTTKMASFSGLSASDLSAYSKVNLWFYNSTGTTYANLSVFSILLCSDSDGNTPVYTLRFPNSVAPPQATWVPITIDNGSNFSLATSINSITLSANRQIHTAATNVYIDNVFASKNFRLDGLISKNSTTSVDVNKPELWWAPRSVTNNVVTLEQSPSIANYTTSPSRGYPGATESVPGYVLAPMVQAASSSIAASNLNTITGRIGTAAEPIIIGGGWDRDTMTQQISGVSWLRSSHGTQYFISQSTSRNIIFNNLGFARCENGIRVAGTSVTATSGVVLNNVHTVATREYGIYFVTGSVYKYSLSGSSAIQSGLTDTTDGGIFVSSVGNFLAVNCVAANCYGSGISVNLGSINSFIKNIICINNDTGTATGGFSLNSSKNTIESLSCIRNDPFGFYIGSVNRSCGNTISNLYINQNGSTTVANAGGVIFDLTADNKIYNALVVGNSGAAGNSNTNGGVIFTGQACETYFYNLSTQDNRIGSDFTSIKIAVPSTNDTIGNIYFKNWNYNESTKIFGWTVNDSTTLYSTNESNLANNHYVYTNNGTVVGTTVSARSPGICWQMDLEGSFGNPVTTFVKDESYPLVHDIKSILCTENIPITASIWIRRTDSTITGKFVARGYQLNGIDNNISVYTTAASLTDWEKLSIVCNPTETGFIEFEMHAYSSTVDSRIAPTGILIWDDFNVTPSTAVAATSGDYSYIAQGVVVSTPISASGGSVATPTEKSFTFC